ERAVKVQSTKYKVRPSERVEPLSGHPLCQFGRVNPAEGASTVRRIENGDFPAFGISSFGSSECRHSSIECFLQGQTFTPDLTECGGQLLGLPTDRHIVPFVVQGAVVGDPEQSVLAIFGQFGAQD